MNRQQSEDLPVVRLGSRFASDDTERDYRDWRIGAAIPFIRIGWIASMINWLTTPIVVLWIAPEIVGQVAKSVFFLVLPMVLISLTATYIGSARHVVFPLTALSNAVAGLVLVWVMREAFQSQGAHTPYVMAASLVMAFFAFTIFRLPLALAMTATVPFLSLGLFLSFAAYVDDVIDLRELGANLTFTFVGVLSGILVCIILDVITRRNFTHLRTIDFQQRLIRRYVPPAVADQIIAGNAAAIDSPQRHRITVLFSDIVGFTDIADRVEPEVITEALSDYMSSMVGLIEAHGGTLNEFAGDGLMALFGAPNVMPVEEQARCAISAANAMQARMPALNERWRKLGLDAELKTRIGINTGMVSVGSYGSIGRMTYTAIGLQANIASRIEAAAEPGEILISDATWQLVRDDIECEPKGEVECKGVHFPVKVYAVCLPNL